MNKKPKKQAFRKVRAKTLITTAIDYTNDVIHIGQAYEKVLADAYARYERLRIGEKNVGFITGTDEHGTTNDKAAKAKNVTTLEHVTEVAKQNKKQVDSLNISYDRFIRTTDKDHKKIASEFFAKSFDNGDIYKNIYEGLYCEGCEAHKTLSELDDKGCCKLHPTRKIQKLSEENYFFKLSNYSEFLKELISSGNFILPKRRQNEMLSFIETGLIDTPISRPVKKLSWGIPVPGDKSQIIYVWFDALVNYFTFGSQNNFWDGQTKIIHFVGKDISRFHTLLWPAMLKSAGYEIPDTVYVHGFINLNEKKISKSTGNVIRPSELVKKYGVDAVRYFFLKYGPIVEDVNVSLEQLNDVYNGELANGLGNTVARVAKLVENSRISFEKAEKGEIYSHEVFIPFAKEFRPDKTIHKIWKIISEVDKHVNKNEPWKIENKEKLKKVLQFEVEKIRLVANLIEPFIPETAKKIRRQFNKSKIKSTKALFPRVEG